MLSKISLTDKNLKDILDAFEHFFPTGMIYSADKPFTSMSGEYSWPNRAMFIDFVYRLTDIKIRSDKDLESMKEAQQKLAKMVLGSEEESKIESNLPDKEARAMQEKEAELRKAEIKETQEKARKEVERSTETLKRKYEQRLQNEKYIERNQKPNISEQPQNEQIIDQAEEFSKEEARFEEIYKTEIERSKEIESELENKNVYVKLEVPPQEEPDKNIQSFIDEAKNHPQEFQKEISNNLRESLLSSDYAKNFSAEEISLVADKTANDIVYAVNNPLVQSDLNNQVAILNSLSKSDVVNNLNISSSAKDFLKTGPQQIGYFKNSNLLSRNILASFNEKLATAVFGPDPQKILVTFYENPVNGYTHNVNLGTLNRSYSTLVQNQSQLGGQIRSLGKNQVKNFFMGQARSFLDKQIAKLPAQSLLKGVYNSTIGQKILNLVGLSKNTLFGEGLFGNILSKIPGVPNFLQGLAGKIGIDLGFSSLNTGVSAVTSMASQGAKFGLKSILGNALLKIAPGLAAKLGIGAAASAAAGAAAGTAAGAGSGFLAGLATGPGAIITAIIGALVGLIKALWPKIREFFKTYGVGIGAVLFGGGLLMGSPIFIAAGAPILIFSIPAAGGLKAATNKLGTLAKIILAALLLNIGKPLTITFISLPIVAAFMLLLINSGAYVVPNRDITESPFTPITCSGEKGPVSFSNNTSSKIAGRAWEIVGDLYQGFWCFWNRSPKAPPPYDVKFPNDVVLYPPSYPDLFNYSLFEKNPSPTAQEMQNCGSCMYWCTQLIQNAYRESGNKDLEITLWAPTMQDDFIKRNKFVSSKQAAYKSSFLHKEVLPGSVIFFHVLAGQDRTNHVGIVYSVNIDGITYVQSNSPTKDGFVPFGEDGQGLQNLPGIDVVGIGLP